MVINCGSSSLKYQLINSDSEEVLAKGLCERIGIDGSAIVHQPAGGEKVKSEIDMPNHTKAVQLVIEKLTDPQVGVITSLEEIDAVGHRIVHGGERFAGSVVLDDEVLAVIEQCNDLAPLHNPANLIGINSCREIMPDVPMVGVFDTAFHQTMPKKAYLYGLPLSYYEKYKVRRYGFHGTSHRYVSMRAAEFLGIDPTDCKMVTCHVGNGGSITAVLNGKSVDTSMGLTPTEGLMMGTRVGDVDPGALTYLMNKHGLSSAQLQNIINKESGVAGVSGLSNDMREIEAAVKDGHERATLALDMYEQRIIKYIGAYAAEMGGLDVIVFTGGVGENQTGVRENVCAPLKFMGVEIDTELNARTRGTETLISLPTSKVKVVVIPTDEELMIARDTEAIVKGA